VREILQDGIVGWREPHDEWSVPNPPGTPTGLDQTGSWCVPALFLSETFARDPQSCWNLG